MAGRAPGGPEVGKPGGGGGSFPYRRGSEGPTQVPAKAAATPDTSNHSTLDTNTNACHTHLYKYTIPETP